MAYYFPHCNDQPECELHVRPETCMDMSGISPLEQEGTLRTPPQVHVECEPMETHQQEDTSATYLNIQEHASTESTPHYTQTSVHQTRQLSPCSLLTKMVEDKEKHMPQNASIVCEVEEPEERGMTDSKCTYSSKAAIQICKAIGTQQILLREYANQV